MLYVFFSTSINFYGDSEASSNCRWNPVASCGTTFGGLNNFDQYSGSSLMYSGNNSRITPVWDMRASDDMCQLDDKDDFSTSVKVILLFPCTTE